MGRVEVKIKRLVKLETPMASTSSSTATSSAAAFEADLSRTAQAAARFYGDSNPENTVKFDDALLVLIRTFTNVDPSARLTLAMIPLREILNYVPILLTATTTGASTRSKLLRLLFNIAQHNVRIRRYLAGDMQLGGPVWDCLKLSLKEQLGPQNLIDILRLMQVITYERFHMGNWTSELISFLLKELSREEEQEWLPYSIAILCNIASRSKTLSQRMRKSSSYKEFGRRLPKLLQHDSRVVVVSALVLIGYLEEKLRELVYCTSNIAQTFQCVFNVLILGDTLMTRHIACDLLMRLVISETPTVSSTPQLSATGKDLMNYSYFTRCLQQTASLLVQLDARTQESTKIYDLLLALCSIPSMRTTVCTAVLDTPTTEQRLTTPSLVIARTARMSFDEAIDPGVPLRALRLLNHLMKEAVEANRRLHDIVPEERLRSIVESAVKTPIQTGHEQVVDQCRMVCEGLRLAEAISPDDSIRPSLLDKLSASLCSHLVETQLLSNPVVLYMSKSTKQRSSEGLPEWSVEGVGIVLELIRVLAAFKDHSKPHKDQYWRSIKDDRLLPLLAFAISRGPPPMVHDALILYTHCAQSHSFPSQRLGDLVASCTREAHTRLEGGEGGRGESREGRRGREGSGSRERDGRRKRSSGEDDEGAVDFDVGEMRNGGGAGNGVQSAKLEELITRLKGGLDLKGAKTSDLLAAYESKMAQQQVRERELERLVAAKDAALQQSERLRLQFATSGVGTSDADLSRIRTLVAETEQLRAEKERVEGELEKRREEAEKTVVHVEALKSELADVRKEKQLLSSDIKSERELTTTLRRSIDEFKAKMEKMSKAVLQLQEQIETLTLEVEKKKDEIYRLNEDKKAKDRTIEELKTERDSIKLKFDSTQADLEERKRKMREEMMRLAGQF